MEHWEQLMSRRIPLRLGGRPVPPRYGLLSALLPAAADAPDSGSATCGCGTGTCWRLLLLQRQRAAVRSPVWIFSRRRSLWRNRTAAENGLDGPPLLSVCRPAADHGSILPTGAFDLVVCNPPYYPPFSGKVCRESDAPPNRPVGAAAAPWRTVCAAAAYLLRWGGRFCLVHKPERLADRDVAPCGTPVMEPKRLRFVHAPGRTMPPLCF